MKENILNTNWEKREESVENDPVQDIIKLKHREDNTGEDQDSFPSPRR